MLQHFDTFNGETGRYRRVAIYNGIQNFRDHKFSYACQSSQQDIWRVWADRCLCQALGYWCLEAAFPRSGRGRHMHRSRAAALLPYLAEGCLSQKLITEHGYASVVPVTALETAEGLDPLARSAADTLDLDTFRKNIEYSQVHDRYD